MGRFSLELIKTRIIGLPIGFTFNKNLLPLPSNLWEMDFAWQSHIRKNIIPLIVAILATAAFNYYIIQPNLPSFIYGGLMGLLIYSSIFFYSSFIQIHLVKNVPALVELLINTLAIVIIIFFWVIIILIVVNKVPLNQAPAYMGMLLKEKGVQYGFTYGIIISFVFNLMLSIQDIVGSKTLVKLFIGAYSQPREEERIFLFLDLKSSTTIAEKLGNKEFLNLLNDFFFFTSKSISQSKGAIYKYVGDEVIVTWPMKKGLKDANCVKCFLMIKHDINENREFFMKKYRLIPEFKAGLHGGKVIAGELGFHKKEITYLGDVLNTTSRMEELCNEYTAELLVSEVIMDKIQIPGTIKSRTVGKVNLRGKDQPVQLFEIYETNMKSNLIA